jgi:hypothetical protein
MVRERRRTVLAVVVAAALGGCAGVPLRTMLRLRTLGADDLLAANPRDLDLPVARPTRHWLVYRLAEPSARDLVYAQGTIREAREKQRRGTLSVGVRNDWIAEVHPAAIGTEAATWVRMKRSEGFFELWSGRVPALPART